MSKKWINLSILAAMCLSMFLLTGCGMTTIAPGNVGIMVSKTGKQRGVQDYTTTTGRVYYNPTQTTVIEYPTFVQTVSWTKNPNEGHPNDESITFTCKEDMAVNADISLSYSLMMEKVPAFYVKFRADSLETFTHGFLHNIVRDKMNEIGGRYSIEAIMGDNGPFLQEVRSAVQSEVRPYGVNIDQFGLIGAPRPPPVVLDSIQEKVKATQLALQKENEVAQATADAQKAVAEAQGQADSQIARAKGEAEANRLKAASITDNLIKWYALTNQHDQIWKWDGVMPTVQTGSSGTIFQMPVPERAK